MPKKRGKERKSIWPFLKGLGGFVRGAFSVLLSIVFLVLILGGVGGGTPKGNIAVIPIHGVITGTSVPFGETVGSDQVVGWLQEANNSEGYKAILLDINSPGGSPVASAEIADMIHRIDKPVIAVIRESGASGAYWIASATDKIFANKMSLTGSIGVTAASLAFPGLIADYNITYRRLVAGKYKDAGSPFKEMTDEEEALYDHLLTQLYDEFVAVVAKNRDMSVEEVEELATGFVYLGAEAKELGLVDELGTKQDAIDYLAKEIGEQPDIAEFAPQPSLMDAFAGASAKAFYALGKGMSSSFDQSLS
ncbi:signal peptide peptidase SppA, partial [Candidatus Woesearchaeota archaeon]|nr:signal peptide peptidase SppA [Candidatus Woesearchaeota archaeon]